MSSDLTIANDLVVEFNYTLKDPEGNVIDTSEGRGPLPYLHGKQNIVPGLEEEMTGRKVGDKFDVHVPSEKAYGARADNMVQSVPKNQFENPSEVQVGMQFQVQNHDGNALVVTVVGLEGDEVVLDANHPLAGVDLHFDVEVMSIRPATEEELSHGHVHEANAQSSFPLAPAENP